MSETQDTPDVDEGDVDQELADDDLLDDDLLDDLPPVDLSQDEERGLDDTELGIDLDAGADERVGLDDSVGLEDDSVLFALELPPDVAAPEGEGDLDVIPIEGLGGDDEYGWTEGSAAASDAPWDPAELDMPNLTPLGTEDGGEEGVDEVFDLGGDDGDSVAHLPRLDASMDDEVDDEVDDEPLDALGFDVRLPEAVGPTLPASYGPDVSVAARLTPAIGMRSARVGEPVTWAIGDAIFRVVGDEVERVVAGGLEERRALSVAVGDDGHRVVMGTDRGVARSVDQGRSFAVVSAMQADAFELARERDTDRVWAYSSTGALHRSDDLGVAWSGPLLLRPVVALATPPSGGVVTLCAGQSARPQLARSTDGGQRWSAVDTPPLPLGAEDAPATLSLAVDGDVVAVASDADSAGPHLSTDGGKRWLRVPGLPPAQALAVRRERGGVSVYAAHRPDGGRAVVVRHRPDGGDGGAVLELIEPDAVIHRIDLWAVDDATTRLFVSTSVGLYRVDIALGAA